MVYWLLLLFIGVPLVELYLLYHIARVISIGATILLVIGTGVLGTWLARREGKKTLLDIQRQLDAGSVPSSSLVDGLLILVAGALLVTPGVLTDTVGFALLVPFTRPVFRRFTRRMCRKLIRSDRVNVDIFGFPGRDRNGSETRDEESYDIDVTPEDDGD